MKYYVYTNGCPVNMVDGTLIENELKKLQYDKTDNIAEADILIVNGCHANNDNINDSLKTLNKINSQRKANSILGLAGCIAEGKKDKIFDLFPDLDFWFGPFSAHKLPEILQNHLKTTIDTMSAEEKALLYKQSNILTVSQHNKNVTFINIHEGCNNFCTYCIVPYLRGREFSKPLEDVIIEAKKCTTPIIDLAGQNVSNYKYGLNNLLLELLKLDNILCISCLNSIHPNEIDTNILDLFMTNSKMLPHLEFGLQSGSNRILKLMNRKHTVEDFYKICDYCKDSILTLGADLIVGFPNETEEDFQETVKLLQYSKMFNVNVFTYYKVINTPAATMENQIPETIKNQRKQILLDILQQNFKEFIQNSINKTYRNCILERYDENRKIAYYELPFKKEIQVLNIDKVNILETIKIKEYNENKNCFIGEIGE